MLIRSEMTGVLREAALAAGPGTLSFASLPALLLGEILLLIGP
jgi:hypothetical protein